MTIVNHKTQILGSLFFLMLSAPAAAQTVVFQESFENTTDDTATGAQSFSVAGDSYTGSVPAGQTYTGSPDWINGAYCNGVILSGNNATQPSWTIAGAADNKCRTVSGAQSYGGIRTIARGMGVQFGGGDNNHVVSAYTECPLGTCTTIGSGATNGVMFQTNSLIPVTANRFYTFSVEVGARNCPAVAPATPVAGDPQFQFQILDGGGVATNLGGVLDPCTVGRSSVSVANYQTAPFTSPVTVYTKNIVASAAVKYTGAQLGVKMYNVSGATFGNDGSFDNIRVLDVTPSLTKAFANASVIAGNTTTLTFTVANTSDLLAKPGWSFTDNLPAGMSLASTTVGGTCTNPLNTAGTTATLSGAVGATAITLNGSLPAVASCTVTVTVRVDSTATSPSLQNCGSNFSASSFIIPPAAGTCVAVAVTRPVSLSKIWLAGLAPNAVSLTIAGSNVSSAVAGSSTAPAATTPATAQALLGSTVSLTEAFSNGSAATYSSSLACSKTSDGSAVATTGAGLSQSIVMPTDSAVSCTYTNGRLPILRLQKALPLGRFVAADQFVLSIAGSGGPVSVTTTGSDTTATGTATLNPAAIGAGYSFGEAGASGANLANYATSYACTNALTGGQTPSGSGASFNLTAAAGDDLTCTLSNNRNPLADLRVTKTNTPGVGPNDQAGDSLAHGALTSYAIVVSNAGPDAVTGAILRDPAASRSGLTCTSAPVCSGGACPAGLTLAQLEAGVPLGALANGASITVTLTCAVN